jgi:hypothetical protein
MERLERAVMRFEGFGFRPAMALAEKLRGAALGLIAASTESAS